MPSIRYQQIAPRVRDLFERHGLTYTTGPLPRQVASAWRKVIRLSLPNDWAGLVNRTTAPQEPAADARSAGDGAPAVDAADAAQRPSTDQGPQPDEGSLRGVTRDDEGLAA
jgi:hypothetical protein